MGLGERIIQDGPVAKLVPQCPQSHHSKYKSVQVTPLLTIWTQLPVVLRSISNSSKGLQIHALIIWVLPRSHFSSFATSVFHAKALVTLTIIVKISPLPSYLSAHDVPSPGNIFHLLSCPSNSHGHLIGHTTRWKTDIFPTPVTVHNTQQALNKQSLNAGCIDDSSSNTTFSVKQLGRLLYLQKCSHPLPYCYFCTCPISPVAYVSLETRNLRSQLKHLGIPCSTLHNAWCRCSHQNYVESFNSVSTPRTQSHQ